MSNETDVYAGNVGSVIKVATTTDGDGNEVQIVHVDDSTPIHVALWGTDITQPVSGNVTISTFDSTDTSSPLVALNDTVEIATAVRDVIIQIGGNLVGTLVAEMSVDGTTWFIVGDPLLIRVESGVGEPLDAGGGLWVLNVDGRIEHFRVRCSAYTSGTAAVGISCGLA